MNTFIKFSQLSLRRRVTFTNVFRYDHCTARSIIGNREIVGFGVNGRPEYADRPDAPMPAVRWKEMTSDICVLKEKEKGDWRNLSSEDKKSLYRASFRRTFSEFNAPTGDWKSIVGFAFMLLSIPIWMSYGMSYYVYRGALPESFSDESQRAQLRRMLDLQTNPIHGVASKWDYDNNCWKKN